MVYGFAVNVGVLAIQGDVAEHIAVLRALSVDHKEIRTSSDLTDVTHLIIPGGESTVMSRFLFALSDLGQAMMNRANDGSLAIYGTCAGAILLAKHVTGKHPPKTLGLMDITIERNAYGTQTQSFDTSLGIKGIEKQIEVAFIRAPIITQVGNGVAVLAEHEGHPVLVKQGKHLAGTFHPEARNTPDIHKLFLQEG